MKRSPKVIERKLGRDRAVGLYWGDGVIEIDPRLPSKEYLGTLIHELLHNVLPGLSEDQVEQIERVMTDAIWKRRFRRIKD